MKALNLKTFGLLVGVGLIALGATTLPTDTEAGLWHRFKHRAKKFEKKTLKVGEKALKKGGKLAWKGVVKPIGGTALKTAGGIAEEGVKTVQGAIEQAGTQFKNQLQGGGAGGGNGAEGAEGEEALAALAL